MKTFHSQSKGRWHVRGVYLVRMLALLMAAIFGVASDMAFSKSALNEHLAKAPPRCEREIKAYVVAIEQVYTYNRFGSFNPNGMMYALRRDVVDEETGKSISLEPNKDDDLRLAGKVHLREGKRPRPLILRMNMGDCLEVTFTNLLNPSTSGQDSFNDPLTGNFSVRDGEDPGTRHASIQVNGLEYADTPKDYRSGKYSFGTNVGRLPIGPHNKKNKCSRSAVEFGEDNCVLAAPGETRIYKWYGKQEGGYLFHSMAGPAGGEGDGGQLGLGLFGSVNVQPKDAKWYRSQVTERELELATVGTTKYEQPKINYEATFPPTDKLHRYVRPLDPILNMLKCLVSDIGGKSCKLYELIYSDLNAVIDNTRKGEGCDNKKVYAHLQEGTACGRPYREFTSIFHDEITAVQAFHELENEANPLSSLRDGMAINYGSAGLGSMVMANQRGIGPAANCKECKLEEFFLASWANGDPALVVKENAESGKKEALYPDDPSNVHHSYMGDPVRFRNMHAGPKETHVFHLHAHQWVQDKHDPSSVYLDSQTISPGAVFSYEIHYGGSGNRNFVVGDSIFHCHLYPHFAQGMWELWRSHDVFENGADERKLPDGEIADGTPNPALVPLPRTALAPMPTPEFKGYPFYIAGQKGHRPPQPPKDLDFEPATGKVYGGLPRHRILGATLENKVEVTQEVANRNSDICAKPDSPDLYNQGKKQAACNAKRVADLNKDNALWSLTGKLASANIELFPRRKVTHSDGSQIESDGSDAENVAMKFHRGELWSDIPAKRAKKDQSDYSFPSMGYPSSDSHGNLFDSAGKRIAFRVNGRSEQAGAPFADPCPDNYYVTGTKEKDKKKVETREYRAAYVQFDMTVNKAGWHDPQARIAVLEDDIKGTMDGSRPAEPLFFRAKSGECVVFKATNLIPSNLNLDDFQVYSPTDVIGQHIHLVKFDVTSSDGSGNGWNYEDGTLAADEVRERIVANNLFQISIGGNQIIIPQTHRIFKEGSLKDDSRGVCPPPPTNPRDVQGWKQWAKDASENHPWCGAQTTIQRWWADPLLNKKPSPDAHDRTLRTVFTHDHFGPSSHQQHGLYAALVIEPTLSEWEYPNGQPMGGSNKKRPDGGPTHYAANLIVTKPNGATDNERTAREFNLAFADYAIVYTADNQPVNPPNRKDGELPSPSLHVGTPFPEGISTKDPGTQLINYRNEPIPLRIGERRTVTDDEKKVVPFTCSPAGSNNCFVQKSDAEGDMANVFSSDIHKNQTEAAANIYTESVGNGRLPGDPATPILRMYEGDKVQIRLIQGAQEENHIFTLHGGKWLSQPESLNSGYLNGQPIGISEHFEANIKPDSPSLKVGVDYLYSSSASDNLWDGQWGLLRAFPPAATSMESGLAPINAKDRISIWKKFEKGTGGKFVCKPDRDTMSDQTFNITAWHARDILPGGQLVYNEHFGISDPNAILFVQDPDDNLTIEIKKERLKQEYSNGKRVPEPLILRARAGDCIQVTLFNALGEMPDKDLLNPTHWSFNTMPQTVEGFNFNQFRSSNHVGLHPQLLAVRSYNQDGANVGMNKESTVKPCTTDLGDDCPQRKRYEWYAGDLSTDETGEPRWTPIEFGGVALRDMADVIKHSSHGAIGTLVIEPRDSIVSRSKFGCGPDLHSNASATICDKNGKPLFREFVVVYQDDVSLEWFQDKDKHLSRKGPMPNLRNADDAEDTGQKAFNYRTEPIWARLGSLPSAEPESMLEYDWSNVFNSSVYWDPETPIFKAEAGTPIRIRVVHPGGHPRNHSFTVHGHDWTMNPWVYDPDCLEKYKTDKNKEAICGSTKQGSNLTSPSRFGTVNGIGPARHINILTKAGGDFGIPGDYMYRTQEGFTFGGGLWGILCVYDKNNPGQCRDRGSKQAQ